MYTFSKFVIFSVYTQLVWCSFIAVTNQLLQISDVSIDWFSVLLHIQDVLGSDVGCLDRGFLVILLTSCRQMPA
jgi:hypothetical protein